MKGLEEPQKDVPTQKIWRIRYFIPEVCTVTMTAVIDLSVSVEERNIGSCHQAGAYVVLIHGLGRTERSMRPLAGRLSKEGFTVVNLGYPSRKYPIERLSELLGEKIEENCPDQDRTIHFITHSLGGIILRSYLKRHGLSRLGRVVMLAPPNTGSEIVDRLEGFSLFRWLAGPAGLQLGTCAGSVPNRLGPADFGPGVIAGTKSLNPFFSLLLPGVDDGMVAVERTKVQGMRDFITVRRSHTFIMKSPEVAAQTVYFLRQGRFRAHDLTGETQRK